MKKRKILRSVALVVGTAVFMSVFGQGAGEWLHRFGQKLAFVSVGLQQPENGAAVLAKRVENAMVQVIPSTATYHTTATTVYTTAVTRPTSAPTLPTAGKVPQKAAGAGKVLTQLLADNGTKIDGVAVRNRSGKAFDIRQELKKGTSLSLQKNATEPQVLILHTHTTENYLTYDAGFYNPADIERTKDTSRNICAAGAAIAAALEQEGIRVIHDTTLHDHPQYTGAYSRSEKTAAAILKKYPSIKVVLDVHRDAIMPDNTTHVKPTAVVNGKKAAQIMIIAGVVSTNALPHPNWQKNFSFALQLQKQMAGEYPDLLRPLYVVASRYNQHLSPGYLLVEIGSDVNTVEEAVYSGTLLGKSIAKLLIK